MDDLFLIVLGVIIYPFIIYAAWGFGMLGFGSLSEGFNNAESWREKTLYYFQGIMGCSACIFFIIGPILHNGLTGLVMMILGAIVWGIFFKKNLK